MKTALRYLMGLFSMVPSGSRGALGLIKWRGIPGRQMVTQ